MRDKISPSQQGEPSLEGSLQSSSQSGNMDAKTETAFFENLKWLTAREAVAYLRLPSMGALRSLIHRRRIPFSKLGRLLRFDRAELDRFLGSTTVRRRISL